MYLDGEVHGGGGRETANANARHVLDDGGLLEGCGVSAAGARVDGGSQGAGAVLVDLVEGHADGAIISGGWETRGSASARGGGDTLFNGALGRLGTRGSSSLGSALSEKLTLGGSGASSTSSTGSSAHELSDSSGGTDGPTTLGLAQR